MFNVCLHSSKKKLFENKDGIKTTDLESSKSHFIGKKDSDRVWF